MKNQKRFLFVLSLLYCSHLFSQIDSTKLFLTSNESTYLNQEIVFLSNGFDKIDSTINNYGNFYAKPLNSSSNVYAPIKDIEDDRNVATDANIINGNTFTIIGIINHMDVNKYEYQDRGYYLKLKNNGNGDTLYYLLSIKEHVSEIIEEKGRFILLANIVKLNQSLKGTFKTDFWDSKIKFYFTKIEIKSNENQSQYVNVTYQTPEGALKEFKYYGSDFIIFISNI